MKPYSEEFYEKLPIEERAEYRKFEQTLVNIHLKHREKGDGTSPFVIDRRNGMLGRGKRPVLREPPIAGRPEGGRSTCDRAEAEHWVKQYYAPLLWRECRAHGEEPSKIQLTVAEAVEQYISSLEERDADGKPLKRYARRHKAIVSKLRVHVVPELGPMVLSMVRQEHVSAALNKMLVMKRVDGEVTRVPAMRSTRLETLKGLSAVWRHIFSNDAVPFRQAFLEKAQVTPKRVILNAYDLEALDREMDEQSKKGVMSSAQVNQSMLGALHWDQEVSKHRHLANVLPNSAHILALLIYLGFRVSELVKLRWCEINFDEGFVMIPQSKIFHDANGKPNKESHRYAPLQHALVPWLMDLLRIYGLTDRRSESFVVQLTRNEIHSEDPATEDSVIKRVSAVLKSAGTKQPGKSTHFGRSTYISMTSTSSELKSRMIQAFVGHSPYGRSVTTKYFRLRREHLKPEHNTYLKLPSPQALRLKLKTNVGAEGPVKPKKRRAAMIRAGKAGS